MRERGALILPRTHAGRRDAPWKVQAASAEGACHCLTQTSPYVCTAMEVECANARAQKACWVEPLQAGIHNGS